MMSEQIEGVPEGWRLVAIRHAVAGDYFLNTRGLPEPWTLKVSSGSVFAIIRKIEKPKQYRPFANAKEFEPHRDRWFRPKCSPDQCILTTAYNDRGHWTAKEQDTWEAMFELYTFDDGSPFGVEVTE